MARHFLSQADLSADEVRHIFDLAIEMKRGPLVRDDLAGRSLVMFFEKASTRTRLSFEIGMTQLGGNAIYVDRDSSQLSRGESIEDTARVVSRYADLIMARVNAHSTVATLAAYADIPVINGLSDEEHPCQSMADLLTVQEIKGGVRGLKIVFVGDGDNNVTHSLMIGGAQLGAEVVVAAPEGFQPHPRYVQLARDCATAGGGVTITTDARDAVRDADVLYTDVWVSMGREAERDSRIARLSPYRVDGELMSLAGSSAIFMHCLPAHIGEEVTADVAYGPASVVFDQAENRLHAQKALMAFLFSVSKGGLA
jgi:ornithine carbamoyltransferase